MDSNTKPIGFNMAAERPIRRLGAEMPEASREKEKRGRYSPNLLVVRKEPSKYPRRTNNGAFRVAEEMQFPEEQGKDKSSCILSKFYNQ